ncbi:MAG: hypothetical protein HZB26_05685 [Candidatus Hydrogenedentes bacterium]|nr:hypothetical protein [Candidatus Hydrogenedentota bacterium]
MIILLQVLLCAPEPSMPMDAAPFGAPITGGVCWDDPRELHRVVAHFAGAAPPADSVRLEYWGSRWPEQHAPKDQQPGGGGVGWWELGNWYNGGWRAADAAATTDGQAISFTFRPINAKEFPALRDYPAEFRYTLKVRVVSDSSTASVERVEAFTDSVWTERVVRLVWRDAPASAPTVNAFNGAVKSVGRVGPSAFRATLLVTTNSDPNTYDRTLLTIHNGATVFTISPDDLNQGPLFIPAMGAAVLTENDERSYADLASSQEKNAAKSLYDRVAELPEQTWSAAWAGMPAKRGSIYLPLGLDGGRQRFQLDRDGSVTFRTNDAFLRSRPGRETPLLDLEAAPVRLHVELPPEPTARTIEDNCLPMGKTTWEKDGVRIEQSAFVTPLSGARADGPAPDGDAAAVLMMRFTYTNLTDTPQTATLHVRYQAGEKPAEQKLRLDPDGFLYLGDAVRGEVQTGGNPFLEANALTHTRSLAPHESHSAILKTPYVPLTDAKDHESLRRLDFTREFNETKSYWTRRIGQSARLITPEPMLNEFYSAHAAHLLINCEREPQSDLRFARVGSFGYGAFGNESCMMVVDLDRRGYHEEARQCLEAWLHYQGTVALPGDFSSQVGVLYGAGGYEAGGYNQHHGWILWCLTEHYRFTQDRTWLDHAAPGILAGAEWVIRERARTASRDDLGRGLLPAGSLEDIGDWWFWLSTNCYTWRGLDSAAWALEQAGHPEAKRVRGEADAYRAAILTNFRAAAQHAPVVRLRDGTAVPKFPSHPHRRGRMFGWICETLEGAIHLLITGVLDPKSPEAEWILKDYEDNLYLSNQWGYVLDDFDAQWFGRGGMSMQACLLLDVEPYLFRNDIKQALRAQFNAIAVGYFPDVRMLTEHALPNMGDWRGDHYKSSDEANAAGWLRYQFLREENGVLLVGQAIPRDWLKPGQRCGIERAETYFGPMNVHYTAEENAITARIDGATRPAPRAIRVRFREPHERPLESVTVNGKPWSDFKGEWVELPGTMGTATVVATWTAR